MKTTSVLCETCAPDYGYRLQYSKTNLGDIVNFGTKLEWHNKSAYSGAQLRDTTTDVHKRSVVLLCARPLPARPCRALTCLLVALSRQGFTARTCSITS